MAITGFQAGAARCLLGNIPVEEVVGFLEISKQNYYKFERENAGIGTKTKETLRLFFENRGAQFHGKSGVVVPEEKIRILRESDGFRLFMDDVYNTVKITGGEICVANVDERHWIKWMGQNLYDAHAARMSKLANFNFKILIRETDNFFIASEIGDYRGVPEKDFSDQSFYVYGNKMAVIKFAPDDVEITIHDDKSIADGMRYFFNLIWPNAKVLS
ncbi:MAG: hypothetical protein KDI13_07865 [Alphaproteobacteria bacterium]|nr:hypothetical protein [Alphaproteobacteria bacterium]